MDIEGGSMSEPMYDSREADIRGYRNNSPQPDGLLGAFDMQLDRLDATIARLQERISEITGPDYAEASEIRQSEPITSARKRVLKLVDLVDALQRTIDRIDI